jgi:hypothetical protein
MPMRKRKACPDAVACRQKAFHGSSIRNGQL